MNFPFLWDELGWLIWRKFYFETIGRLGFGPIKINDQDLIAWRWFNVEIGQLGYKKYTVDERSKATFFNTNEQVSRLGTLRVESAKIIFPYIFYLNITMKTLIISSACYFII